MLACAARAARAQAPVQPPSPPEHRGIGVDDSPLRAGGDEQGRETGRTAFTNKGDQTADVRRRIRTAVDQIPFIPRLGGRYVAIGGTVHAGRKRRQGFRRHTDHAGFGGRKPAPGQAGIERGHHRDPAAGGHGDQGGEQAVLRAGQAEIDHLGAMVDREVQRLGQAEAVAQGGRGGRAVVDLPAGAQGHQPGARRDAGDAQAVAGLGRDHPGDAGAVPFGRARAVGHEILVGDELARQIGMVDLDPAVDDRDLDALAGGDLVQVGQPPGRGGRLRREQRVVLPVVAALGAIDPQRLGPGHAGVVRDLGGRDLRRLALGRAHHVAVQPDQRHRPALADQGQAVPPGDRLGRALAGPAREAVAVASAIGGAGPIVFRSQAQHDQHVARRGVRHDGRRRDHRAGGGLGKGGGHARDGEQARADQRAPAGCGASRAHGLGSPSIGSARVTSPLARRWARASGRRAASTCRT